MATPEPIPFVGGDDFVEPFVVGNSDGTVADLTGATVTGLLRAANRPDLVLTVGLQIEVTDPLPDAGEPHGYVRLSRAETAALPIGPASSLRLSVVFPSGLLNSTLGRVLERVA